MPKGPSFRAVLFPMASACSDSRVPAQPPLLRVICAKCPMRCLGYFPTRSFHHDSKTGLDFFFFPFPSSPPVQAIGKSCRLVLQLYPQTPILPPHLSTPHLCSFLHHSPPSPLILRILSPSPFHTCLLHSSFFFFFRAAPSADGSSQARG